MTVKDGRHLNLELEKKYKENEEKLLQQAKQLKTRQLPFLKQQCRIQQKPIPKTEKIFSLTKSTSNKIRGNDTNMKKKIENRQPKDKYIGNTRHKLVSSIPDPEPGIMRKTKLGKLNCVDNIVVDSDTSSMFNLDEMDEYFKESSKKEHQPDLVGKGCNDIDLDNLKDRRCGCFNYSALFIDLENDKDVDQSKVFRMGSLKYEQKIRDKIRILEQQEKFLNNRIIVPKVVDGVSVGTDNKCYSFNQPCSAGVIRNNFQKLENKETVLPKSTVASQNLPSNNLSEELQQRVSDKKYSLLHNLLDELFISKVSENIVDKIRKYIVRCVEKHSDVLQTNEIDVKKKDTKSAICQTSYNISDACSSLESSSNCSSTKSNESNNNTNERILKKDSKVTFRNDRRNLCKDVACEDKSVNTDENIGNKQKHTRHKSTCKKCFSKSYRKLQQRNSLEIVSSSLESNGSIISSRKLRNNNHSNEDSMTRQYYKAVQVVVNVHTDGKVLHESTIKEIPEKIGKKPRVNNWRKIFDEGEDKLTESSYCSPPDVLNHPKYLTITNTDKEQTKIKTVNKENKKLQDYIERLLSMKRESIDQLDVSSCSTPSELSLIFDRDHSTHQNGTKNIENIEESYLYKLINCQHPEPALNHIPHKSNWANKPVDTATSEKIQHIKEIGCSNSLTEVATQHYKHRQISQPDIKLLPKKDILDTNDNSVKFVVNSDDRVTSSPIFDVNEMNKQFLHLNLSITDFEENLKALFDEFDQKLHTIKDYKLDILEDETSKNKYIYAVKDDKPDTLESNENTNLDLNVELDRPTLSNQLLCSKSPAGIENILNESNNEIDIEIASRMSNNTQINLEDAYDTLPSMADLMRLGLIDCPFKYAQDGVPYDDDIKKILQIGELSNDHDIKYSDSDELQLNEPLNVPVLSPTTATTELEHIVRQLGLSWMSSTLQKTKEASALVSSSSGENTNEKQQSLIKHASSIANSDIPVVKNQAYGGDHFTPVLDFFKNNEKLISPIGIQSAVQNQVFTISSSQKI